jgi:hypothetical protein
MADERDRTLARLAVESGYLTQDEAGGYWQRVQAPGSPRLAQLLMQEGRLSPADMANLRQRFFNEQGSTPSGRLPRPEPGSDSAHFARDDSTLLPRNADDPNWAKSLEKDGLLARVLLNRGQTTQDRLRECRQIQLDQQQRLGAILVEKGYVERGMIADAMALVRERMGHEPTLDLGGPEAPVANFPPGTGSFGRPQTGGFGPPPGTSNFGPPPGPGGFGPPPTTGGFAPPPGTGNFGPPPGTGNFGPPPGAGGFGPPPGTGNFGPPPGPGGFGPPPGAGSFGPAGGIDGGGPPANESNPFASVRATPSPLAGNDEPPAFGSVSVEELNPFGDAGGGKKPSLELSMDELNPFAGGAAAPAPDGAFGGSDSGGGGGAFGDSGGSGAFGGGGAFGDSGGSGAFGGGGAFGDPGGGGAFGDPGGGGAFGDPGGGGAFGDPGGGGAFGDPGGGGAFGDPGGGGAFGDPGGFPGAAPAAAPAPAFGGDPWSAPPAPSSGLTPAGVPVGGQADSLRNKGGSGSLARQEGKRAKRKKKATQAATNTKALVIGIVIMVLVVIGLVVGVVAFT